MKRKRRTEILIRGERVLTEKMAAQISERYPVSEVDQPQHGLVMMKMRETAQKTRFYIGEMFVTQAKVSVVGATGIGIVQGDEPKLAFELAVIDAAYMAGLAETQQWNEWLEAEEQKIAERQHISQQKLLLTKVNFETMQEEDQT